MTRSVLDFMPVAVFASVTIGLTSVHGAEQAPPSSPELKNYQRTGEYKSCLTIHSIRDIQILNDRQILFKMGGGKAYLAEPQHCSGLSRGLALSYDATLDQLCNSTIVHLLDASSPVPERGTCGIERFERLKKTPQ